MTAVAPDERDGGRPELPLELTRPVSAPLGVAARQRPGSRCRTSWSTQPLPSGSLKVAK
ncbi:hypothetical protein SALBM217S_06095 [Streptomyces griseoloalbus]